jgi:hypothetical protein
MKKLVQMFWVLGILVMVLGSCSSDGGGYDEPKGADEVTTEAVTDVIFYKPEDVVASGASNQWESIDDMIQELPRDIDEIPLFSINKLLSDDEGASRESMMKLNNVIRAAANIEGFLEELGEALDNFPITKKIDKSIKAENSVAGEFFIMKNIDSTIKASVVTTDGAPLDYEEMTNYKSGYGRVTLNAELCADKDSFPDEWSFKDFKVRVNCAASASSGSVEQGDYRVMNNLKFSYATRASIAMSCDEGGTGGKIIINVYNADKPVTLIPNPDIDDETGELENKLLPKTFKMTVSLYKDNGEKVFEETYNSVDEVMADLDY